MYIIIIYLHSILILCFMNFILFSKGEIIQNPVKLENDSNIDDYIIIMNEQIVIVEQNSLHIFVEIQSEKNEIMYKGNSYFLNQNIFLCQDQSNYYFLFAINNFYEKTPNNENDNEIKSLNRTKTFSNDIRIFGYIKEKENEKFDYLCGKQKDEILIYGVQNENSNFFYYKKQNNIVSNYINNIGDIISCKLIISSLYLCAYIHENYVYVRIIAHKCVSNSNWPAVQESKKIENFKNSKYESLALFDTDDDKY